MTEPSSAENKTSVVDDFFSALFASNNNSGENSASTSVSSSSRDTAATPIPTTNIDVDIKMDSPVNERPSTDQVESQEAAVAQPQVLDEFDEYSLLSSRRRSDANDNARQSSTTRQYPRGEAPAKILAVKDIDWSNVNPESRMLIRQLPKNTNKQDIMDYFSKYGQVIEVVQKNAFGFVHFENPEMCARAVAAENGKIFNDVILDLEICKRKPFFARREEAASHRTDNSPPRHRKRDFSPNSDSRSRSPPSFRGNKRRNSNPRVGNTGRHPKAMNVQRNRQLHQRESNGNNFNGNTSPPRRNNLYDQGNSNDYRPDYGRHDNNINNNSNNNNDTINGRGFMGRKNDSRYNEVNQDAYGQYDNSAPSLVPTRSGNEVPAVQIISWNSGFNNFVSRVSSIFAQHQIHTASITLQYSPSTRENIVKQMIIEGVKAVIMINGANESKGKVYLQVFASDDQSGGVRFDEYDSVTPIEAVNIFQSAYPHLKQYVPKRNHIQQNDRFRPQNKQNHHQHQKPYAQSQYSYQKPQYKNGLPQVPRYQAPPPPQFNASPQQESSAQYSPSAQYNTQQYYSPTRPQYVSPPPPSQNQYVPPQYTTSSPQTQQSITTQPPLDANTLASIYNLIQSKNLPGAPTASTVSTSPSVPAAPTASQASIPQLLATLMNGLGMSNATSTPPVSHMPVPAVNTAPPMPQANPLPAATAAGQPSVAALLSTAVSGNPALAQMLLQMTSGANNVSSPSAAAAKTNVAMQQNQASPNLMAQPSHSQQELNYGAYGYGRS